MKRIFALASMLVLLSGNSALAEDLQPVGTGDDGLDYYLDLDTIQRPRPRASFTLIADLDPPNRYGVTRYSIFEWVDCNTRQSLSRTKTTHYVQDNTASTNLLRKRKPYTSAPDETVLDIEAGTVRAEAFRIACAR